MFYRTSTRFAVTLAALLGVAACAEPPGPTAVRAGAGPSFDFTNNPDNGNPRILRFGEAVGFLIIDEQHNLFSLQAGTDRQFGCQDPSQVFDVMSVQWLLANPDDPMTARVKETRLGADAYIAVFRGPFPGVPIVDCADLMSRKIAEGTGNFVNTDNDIFAYLYPSKGHNAFGFTAQGQVQQLDGGGTVHYNGVSKCVWDGTDLATVKCEDRINIE